MFLSDLLLFHSIIVQPEDYLLILRLYPNQQIEFSFLQINEFMLNHVDFCLQASLLHFQILINLRPYWASELSWKHHMNWFWGSLKACLLNNGDLESPTLWLYTHLYTNFCLFLGIHSNSTNFLPSKSFTLVFWNHDPRHLCLSKMEI